MPDHERELEELACRYRSDAFDAAGQAMIAHPDKRAHFLALAHESARLAEALERELAALRQGAPPSTR